jgi:ketosteroid isomerase-like protein
MDTTELLQNIYRCYREKRLAEAVSLLSDDFQFKSNIADDPIEPQRPRSRAELTLLAHKFFEDYDILLLEPAAIIADQGTASAHLSGTFRHKKTGRVFETTFRHDWRFTNGKICELQQHHDDNGWLEFLKSLSTEAP